MSLISRFISANRRLCSLIEQRLPTDFTRHLHTVYKYRVAELVNAHSGQVVLDIGAGKQCPFLPFIRDKGTHLILGTDFSEYELRCNSDVRSKIVADAAGPGFPVRDGSVDVAVSRSVVEHLPDNAAFVANCARVLRPGGVMVHTFPCKWAPFALVNRLLPNRLTRRLLAWLHPAWRESCGFPAFYDHCRFSEIRDLLAQNGFRNQTYEFRYYQSIYYTFLFPLYALMLLYDLTIWYLGIRNLACGILVVAEKPSAGAEAEASPAGRTAVPANKEASAVS